MYIDLAHIGFHQGNLGLDHFGRSIPLMGMLFRIFWWLGRGYVNAQNAYLKLVLGGSGRWLYRVPAKPRAVYRVALQILHHVPRLTSDSAIANERNCKMRMWVSHNIPY